MVTTSFTLAVVQFKDMLWKKSSHYSSKILILQSQILISPFLN